MNKKFFIKNKENLRAGYLKRCPTKGGPRQVPRSPSLKHTTACMPLVRAEYQYYHGLLRRFAARSNQGRNDGEARGTIPRALLTAGVLTMSQAVHFNAVHLLPKDLRYEHGGAKLASCPGAI